MDKVRVFEWSEDVFISLLSLHGKDNLLGRTALEDILSRSSIGGGLLELDDQLVLLGGSSL